MIDQAKALVRAAENVVNKHDDGTLAKARGDSKAIESLRDSFEELRRAIWAAEDAKT
jgi:hypothetical protein